MQNNKTDSNYYKSRECYLQMERPLVEYLKEECYRFIMIVLYRKFKLNDTKSERFVGTFAINKNIEKELYNIYDEHYSHKSGSLMDLVRLSASQYVQYIYYYNVLCPCVDKINSENHDFHVKLVINMDSYGIVFVEKII